MENTTYERVTYKRNESDTPRSIILRDPVEIPFLGSETALTGIQVNLEGAEVAPHGIDERQHIIDSSLIVKRQPMRWNLHYGTLES